MQRRNRLTLVSLLLLAAVIVSACAPSTTGAPAAAPTAAPAPTKAPVAAEPTKAPDTKPTDAPAPAKPTDAPAPTAPALTSVMPEVDPAAVTGDIVSAGSSTVFPLSEAMAARALMPAPQAPPEASATWTTSRAVIAQDERNMAPKTRNEVIFIAEGLLERDLGWMAASPRADVVTTL